MLRAETEGPAPSNPFASLLVEGPARQQALIGPEQARRGLENTAPVVGGTRQYREGSRLNQSPGPDCVGGAWQRGVPTPSPFWASWGMTPVPGPASAS